MLGLMTFKICVSFKYTVHLEAQTLEIFFSANKYISWVKIIYLRPDTPRSRHWRELTTRPDPDFFTTWTRAAIFQNFRFHGFKNGFLKQSKFWPIWLNLCLGTADVLRTHYHIWKLIPDKKLYNLTLQYIVRQAILEHILKSTVEKNYLPLNLKSTSKFSSPPLNLRSTSKTPKSCMLWRCAGLQAKETNDK